METPKWRFPIRSPVARSPITPVSSSSEKSVCLLDWWVVKPDGGEAGLVVSGLASTGSGDVRLFSSARISKRITTTILEAVDGIHITLTGPINRFEACQNGFSNSFSQHFQFGFPYDWEEYSTRGTSCKSAETGELPKRDGSGASSSETRALLAHLDTLPASGISSFLMSLPEHSKNCMLDSILSDLRQNSSQHTPTKAHSATTERTAGATGCGKDGAPRSHTNDFVDRNCSGGVMTRSMSRKCYEAQPGEEPKEKRKPVRPKGKKGKKCRPGPIPIK